MKSCRTIYKDGSTVYSLLGDRMEISTDWMFDKLRELGCNVNTYGVSGSVLNIHGNYPKTNYVEVKKFLYDNYPYVLLVEPRRYSIRIHFNIKIVVVYNLDLY